MNDQPQNPNPQPTETPAPEAPAAEQAPAETAAETPAAAPTEAPAEQETAQQTPPPQQGTMYPSINVAEWDQKKTSINKSFFKVFSPRLLGIPFSYAIDVNRARTSATKKGYTVPENAMVLSKSHFIFGAVMIEVTGASSDDGKVVTLGDVYTKVVDGSEKAVKNAMPVLEGELGGKPSESYVWYVTVEGAKKAVIIALNAEPAAAPAEKPAEQSAAQPQEAAPSATPEPATTPEKPAPAEQPQEPAEQPAAPAEEAAKPAEQAAPPAEEAAAPAEQAEAPKEEPPKAE